MGSLAEGLPEQVADGICRPAGETMNDAGYGIMEICERIKVATECNRVFGGKNVMWCIGFHNAS